MLQAECAADFHRPCRQASRTHSHQQGIFALHCRQLCCLYTRKLPLACAAEPCTLHCRFDQLHNAQPHDLGSSPFTAATLETLQRRCDAYEAQMDAHAREREEHLRALAERDDRIVSTACRLPPTCV